MTTQLKAHCPNCNITINWATPLGTPTDVPQTGDFLICESCGNINKLDENEQVVKSTKDDLIALKETSSEEYFELIDLSAFIMLTNAKENGLNQT
jgi:hypothetical protein